jgi:hypothetical protein
MMVMVAVVALAFAGVVWTGWLRRRAAYFAFVAGAYEVEAKNHTVVIASYRNWAADQKRPGYHLPQGYQVFPLYSNDWGGRLTTARQDEWDPYGSRPRDPDPVREASRLLAESERERARAAYFAALGAKYRRAAARPWLPVGPDPQPLP